MKNLNLLLVIMMFSPSFLVAQEEEKKYGIEFSGFVKNDFIFDTRQTVAAREGHFLLWPQPESLDPDGNDINAKPNFNYLSIQSRLKGVITAPDVLGAKTSGIIEGAFFGHSNLDVNGFRLRHAFLKMEWQQIEMITGQYWNPMFAVECFPGVISFNTGTVFQPFARNPQIRLAAKTGTLKFIGTAYMERDFASRDLTGASNTSLKRNAYTPDLSGRVQFKSMDENGNGIVTGIGAAYHSIMPSLTTATGYKSTAMVHSFSGFGYAKYVNPSVTAKVYGVFGQNMPNVLFFGGYGVAEVVDTATSEVKYAPTNNLAFWAEVHTNGDKVQLGIFGGYNQNLGAFEDIIGAPYGLGTNIAYAYRVAPRIVFKHKKVRFAGEVEYTAAAFGASQDPKGVPQDLTEVGNIRFLLATYLFF